MISILTFFFVLVPTVLPLPTDTNSYSNAEEKEETPNVNIKFYCIHSSDLTYKETRFNDEKLSETLDLSEDTTFAFYVHGWQSRFHFDKEDSNDYKIGIEWIKSGTKNFCGVHWGELANGIYHDAALLNIKIVGSEIALFVKSLNKNNVKLESISFAGHSLGAHTCGIAGSRVQETLGGKISRIYGLDPAGPRFNSVILHNSNVSLSDKDANFVQILHTSSGTLGTIKSLGHANFRANNGAIQESCLPPNKDLKDILNLIPCSHSHAIDIFHSSFTHSFVGTQYESDTISKLRNILTFDEGVVTDLYGIHSKGLHGYFKLITSPSPPYCIDCDKIIE